eukprot:scaffold55883_cov29-Cyclotella_meneghiniana.AAC.1
MATPSAAAPSWANTANSSRPPPVEDTGNSSSSGMDELLAPVSTLDEPVSETIMRDVRAVGGKLKAVLLPLDRSSPFGYVDVLQEEDVEPSEGQRNVLNQLRDWELWWGTIIHLSKPCSHLIHESSSSSNIACLYNSFHRHVDRIISSYRQCPITRSYNQRISITLRFRLLCLSTHGIGINHRYTSIYLAWYCVFGFDMASPGFIVGNPS